MDSMIYQFVPDLTSVYHSIKDLKEYTRHLIETVQHDIHWTQVLVKYNSVIEKFRYIVTLHVTLDGKNPVECSKAYRDKMDDFLRYMFALEKEAILSWMKYLIVTGNLKESRLLMDMSKKFTEEQRDVFNKKGCGFLKAENLGTWDSTPVCYVVPPGGSVSCTHAKTTTTCAASCPAGWRFHLADKQVSTCDRQPCSSFRPEKCDTCTKSAVCKDDEVCDNGKCVPGCRTVPCGVNARCSTTNHDPSDLQPPLAVSGPTVGPHHRNPSECSLLYERICGLPRHWPDGGLNSGWIWQNRYCNYEYEWKEHRATSYEGLVDPCGGKGVEWVCGVHSDMVFVAEAKRWPGVKLYVCSSKHNGVPGQLFNTRSGFLCHIWFGNVGYRDENFYSLVKRACV
ncbi:uncharacterized protein LOC114796766 [Denticeps clupeoides]|uniref:uncharacterized protein LOC114796766 n=1 Tax=Denticeps clupeoides TaxID=299321 RepID=UPI0010A52632|nr:uncharacterized protein LOC114796766 [Denticeps clupeoides]